MNKEEKRVELRLHTCVSKELSVIKPYRLIREAVNNGYKAIAITDRNSAQNLYSAAWHCKRSGTDIKLICGAALSTDPGDEITVLVKEQDGLKALYKLLSGKTITQDERALLLYGAHDGSALHRAACTAADTESLCRLAESYDYIELGPAKARTMNRRLYDLGKVLGKPVVAVGDCHYLYPRDGIATDVLNRVQGRGCEQEENYLRTTGEMLELYGYLGEAAAYEVVVTNTNLVADQIGTVDPQKDLDVRFSLPDADGQVRRICLERLQEVYGAQELPRQRLEQELALLGEASSLFLLFHKLVKHLHEKGALTGFRGTVGSTLVAWLLGISDTNPLPAHHYCPVCKHTEFAQADSGYDLPKKNCPHCAAPMVGDGHNLPLETYLGAEGEGFVDINLNTTAPMQLEAKRFLAELLGRERLAVAGTISTYRQKAAEAYLQVYMDLTGREFEDWELEWLTELIVDVKRAEGTHPCGIMLLPEGLEWEDVTPMRPIEDELCGYATSFEGALIADRIPKLNILSALHYDLLQELFRVTGTSPADIDFRDPSVYELFSKQDTCGLPELGTSFIRKLLSVPEEINFSSLVKLSGMSHGTNVWTENGEKLVQEHAFRELIGNRDDVFLTLRRLGIDRKTAYAAMTATRKGILKRKTELIEKLLDAGVPRWYVESMKNVWYLFPKAHAVHYVKLGYMAAWFKLYYPKEFYKTAMVHLYTKEYDYCSDQELNQRLEQLDPSDYGQSTQRDTILFLQEARQRGYAEQKMI